MSFCDFGLVDHRTIYDELEPLENRHDDLRDAAIKYTALINAFGATIERALATGDFITVAVQFWGCAFSMGLVCVDGRSMTTIGESLGLSRATISKHARAFCHANDLEPSFYMKSSEADEAYSEARLDSIAEANERSLPPVPSRNRSV